MRFAISDYDPEEEFLMDASMRLMVSDAAIERALRRFQAQKRQLKDRLRPPPIVRIRGASYPLADGAAAKTPNR